MQSSGALAPWRGVQSDGADRAGRDASDDARGKVGLMEGSEASKLVARSEAGLGVTSGQVDQSVGGAEVVTKFKVGRHAKVLHLCSSAMLNDKVGSGGASCPHLFLPSVPVGERRWCGGSHSVADVGSTDAALPKPALL